MAFTLLLLNWSLFAFSLSSLIWLLISGRLQPHTAFERIHLEGIPLNIRDIILVVGTFIQITVDAFLLGWRIESGENFWSSFARESANVAAWVYALVLFFLALIHKLDRATALLQLQCFYAITLALVLFRLNAAVHELYIGEAALSLEFFLDALLSTINSAVLFWATITMPQEPALEADASDLPNVNPVSPETTASVYSAVTFSWMNTLIYLGNRRTLVPKDLPELLAENRSNTVWHGFLRIDGSYTFLQRLIFYNSFDIIWQFIAALIFTFFEFASPYFLGLFLTYVQDPTTATRDQAYLYIILMFLSQVLRTVIQSQMFFLGRRIDVHLKSILNAEIYAKALRRRNAGEVSSPTANTKDTASKDPLASTLAEGQDKPDASAQGSRAGTGKITNLMSIDAGRVANCANNSYLAITSPLGIIIGSVMLYHWLGWSFLVGLVTAVVIQPLSARLTAWYSEVQKKLLQARDERIALTNELLQSIRMIKFFAWERPFSERILFAREFELDKLFSVYVFSTFLSLVYQSTPLLITLLSFIAFTKLAHGELTAPIAFTSIVLFDKLRWPLMAIPTIITAFVNGAISLRRIENFLSEPEVGPASPTGGAHNAEAIVVGFKNATLTWHGDSLSSSSTPVAARVDSLATNHQFYLRNVDVSFPVGELSVVCGPTGSGKTALLMALLGEMELVAGQVFLPRSIDGRRTINLDTGLVTDQVAFVAEQAWLQNATIRENVLFGQPMNRGRYEEVLRVCALERDLEVWEDGDLTEIGEKGLTLSGGQRQRIALARAVYSHAQNLLLDDCFAAVDAHTAKHIYRECIKGDLMRGRTVVLVTHHVRLCLPGTAYLIKLEHGRVVVAGETVQLSESLLLSVMDVEDELVQMTGGDAPSVAVPLNKEPPDDEDATDNASISGPSLSPLLNRVPTITLQPASPVNALVREVSDALDRKKPHKLVEEERREQGRVRWTIYQFYTDAAGAPVYWALLIVVFLVNRFFNVAEGWWLKIWSTAYEDAESDNENMTMAVPSYDVVGVQSIYQTLGVEMLGGRRVNVNYYLGIYALISLASIAFPVVRVGYTYVGSLKAARVLHQRLLEGVVRAPLRFYDTVPVGRILNRFSKDLEMIDSQLMSNYGELVSSILAAISIFIVISIATPPFLITAIFVGLLYWHVAQLYNNSSRELKRLDSASKSPIFSQFGETIIGVTTIRAFGEQSRFMSEMLVRTDDGLRAYYAFRAANRWLAIRVDFIGALIALLAGLLILLFPNNVDAGLAGLSLTYALNFVYQMNWLVRAYTSMELNLTSVERVHEYVEMPQEPPGIIANSRPPVWWPHDGRIEVRDLVVQYAPQLETVIRGISFDIKAKERVGIVGRTGSGKSTLALSLFRFVDPTKGAIFIDGIDIASIGLEDLRSRLTIIPQDPILLSGNVRSNLDPFNEYTEDEIWESLRRVRLVGSDANEFDQRPVEREDASIISLIASLDDPVSEGGRNFSQGQRQLLCLARALLRNSKIIVMDEATASVDLATDRRIQVTIRQEFKQSTLLCIAHRLRTVIDYDRVLVLDQGQILEYDTPYNLLFNDEDTVFRKMCEASGEMDDLVEAVTLRRLGGGR